MSKPSKDDLRLMLELALVDALRDKELTAAVAGYVHSQCAANKINPSVMLVSLLDVAAAMMGASLVETPPRGSICRVIEPFENYFHAQSHVEVEIQTEAKKK